MAGAGPGPGAGEGIQWIYRSATPMRGPNSMQMHRIKWNSCKSTWCQRRYPLIELVGPPLTVSPTKFRFYIRSSRRSFDDQIGDTRW